MRVRPDKPFMIVAVVAVAMMLMVYHKGKLVLLECQAATVVSGLESRVLSFHLNTNLPPRHGPLFLQ